MGCRRVVDVENGWATREDVLPLQSFFPLFVPKFKKPFKSLDGKGWIERGRTRAKFFGKAQLMHCSTDVVSRINSGIP